MPPKRSFGFVPYLRHFSQTDTTIVYTGYIVLIGNPILHSCAKHINIHYYFTHNYIEHGDIKLCYIPTKDMLVDIFTKGLPHEAFIIFHEHLVS